MIWSTVRLVFCLFISILFVLALTSLKLSKLNFPIAWQLVYFLNDSYCSLAIIVYIYYLIGLRGYHIKCGKITTALFAAASTLSVCRNSCMYEFLTSSKELNTVLNNGLLLIHPIVLYLSFVLFFLNATLRANTILHSWISSIFALYLGGWWAQQELNWGGWWNWDPIEYIALLLFASATLAIHLPKVQSNNGTLLKYQAITLLIVLSYCISRYDVLNSIHSFASVNSSKYTLIKALIVITVILTTFKKKFNFNLSYNPSVIYSLTRSLLVFLSFLLGVSAYYLLEKPSLSTSLLSRNSFITIVFLTIMLLAPKAFSNSFLFLPYFSLLPFLPSLYGSALMKFLSEVKLTKVVHLSIFLSIFLFSFFSANEIFSLKKKSEGLGIINYFYCKSRELQVIAIKCGKLRDLNKFKAEYYTKASALFNAEFSYLKKTFYQTILSNLYVNVNLVHFSKSIIFVQFFLSSQFITLLLSSSLGLWRKQVLHIKVV